MNCSNSISNSLIDFFFFPCMVRVNYRATTLKSSIDIAIASQCDRVVGQHGSKASKEESLLLLLVLAVKKREVLLGLSFLNRMRIEDREMVPRNDGIYRD
jgi:hypothetical protein